MKRSMMVGGAAGLLAGASLATLVLAAPSYAFKTDGATSPSAVTAPVSGNVTASAVGQLNRWGTLPNLADLVDHVSPSVVQIIVREPGSIRTTSGPGLENLPPEFRQFFGRGFGFGDGDGNGQQQQAPDQMASGSGFFIEGGYIVTNNHVVDKAKKVTVRMDNGKEVDATVVGVDPKTDLAVIKVDPKVAPISLKWGDSDKSRVGDSVFAVGSPFGLGNTVTAGIISARSRDIHSGPYDDYFQVDAPINMGNSGGPLLDANGQVIGVNSAIYSPSGGNVGIGFSIPSDMAKSVVEQIIDHGSVSRGWLGVGIQNVTPEIAQSLGMKDAKGALVGEVTADSPASKAGLKTQDVILSYDGHAITNMHDLTRAVADTKAGATKDLKILRNGKQQTVAVKIAALKDTPKAEKVSLSDRSSNSDDHVALDGLGLKLADSDDGPVIADVTVNSSAADSGLQAGDKLLMVNQTEVKSASDAQKAVADAKRRNRDAVLLQLERNGSKLFVGVPFSQS
ncbi:MAG: Do family serine endopeptidase [Alphaproteobacteria bacterium]|nr:Do family serine endopeptidase [Alphaproteobacteria bacterium]